MISKEKHIKKRDFLKLCLCGLIPSSYLLYNSKLLADDKSKLWKWSKEAYYYKTSGGVVECLQCPNGCTISKDDKGICKDRINKNGKLYSLVYGNPCAVHIDPVEKKPFYHFLPGTKAFSIATAGCNLACLNCQNWEISQLAPEETTNQDLMPDKVVENAIASSCKSIAYTYSEPTVFYEYVYDTAQLARKKGIKNIYKSNGYINEKPLRYLCKYLDAANIDLKSFDEKIYHNLNSGSLAPVVDTLQTILANKVWLEITNNIIPSWNDNFDMIKRMSQWLVKNGFSNTPLHFTRFHPLYKLTHLPQTPLSTLEKAREIALNAGMRFVYIGNVPGSNAENTNCPKCGKTLIERRGFFTISNNLNKNACKYCGENIPGYWV